VPQNLDVINLVGNVADPTQTQQADGNTPPLSSGRQGEQLASEVHGKFYTANYRKKLFGFNVTAVTVPVVTSGLVSVFTLYNPPSSNVNAEIVDTEIGQVLATTVVDTIGWYYSTALLTSKGTFSTAGTAFSGIVGGGQAANVIPYSGYTHSGTPVLIDQIAVFGAVTDAGVWQISKFYDGRLILPPGIAMSVAMSTAAGTISGLNIAARWIEWPL
jgi:hypothetical protein